MRDATNKMHRAINAAATAGNSVHFWIKDGNVEETFKRAKLAAHYALRAKALEAEIKKASKA